MKKEEEEKKINYNFTIHLRLVGSDELMVTD